MGVEQEIHEAALALGGEPADLLRPARELHVKTERLNQELTVLRSTEEKLRNELVQQVAAGKLAANQVPSKLTFDWVVDSSASMVIVHANRSLYAAATKSARDTAPAIFSALQRRIAATVAESVKRSVELPRGIDSEQKALRARNDDRKALETWERLRVLVDDWTGCHELARLMQKAGWIAGPEHAWDRQDARLFERYRAPASLPPGYWDRTSAELRLGVAEASGAGHGLFPWPDALARFERLDRRQRSYGSMQVVTQHDSYGNTLSVERSPEIAGEFAPASGVS